MNCRSARDTLIATDGTDPVALRHAEGCPACARFVGRLEAAHELLGERSEISPPPGFALRVRERLETSEDLLGWAALRLLPATLALALVLSWLSLRETDPLTTETSDPETAVVSWLLDDAGLSADAGPGEAP